VLCLDLFLRGGVCLWMRFRDPSRSREFTAAAFLGFRSIGRGGFLSFVLPHCSLLLLALLFSYTIFEELKSFWGLSC
jgi:hypothetical protein